MYTVSLASLLRPMKGCKPLELKLNELIGSGATAGRAEGVGASATSTSDDAPYAAIPLVVPPVAISACADPKAGVDADGADC